MSENYYDDLITHHGNWRQALESQKTGDSDHDSWIDHEVKALDRLVAFHKEYSAIPNFTGNPVALVAEAVELDKRASPAPWDSLDGIAVSSKADARFIVKARPLVPALAKLACDLRTALLDCHADLRSERSRHQQAAATRDDLRIQLAESREQLREENRRHQKAAAERDELRAKLADAEGRNDVLARITDALLATEKRLQAHIAAMDSEQNELRAKLAMAQAKLAVWEAK